MSDQEGLEVEKMLSVRMLKPYYIKTDENYIWVILAYRYFSILIHQDLYQFIPIEAKEIKVNRNTLKIENTNDRFAFQRDEKIVYIPMYELISLPDFLDQLYRMIEPYDLEKTDSSYEEEADLLIAQLERQNVERLIDRSLDERDEKAFYTLVKYLT